MDCHLRVRRKAFTATLIEGIPVHQPSWTQVPSYCHIPEYHCAGLDPEQWMADMKSGSHCRTGTLVVNFDSFWALKLAL